MSKKNVTPITGYRYFFSVLSGISRGPVDQVFQIMSASLVAWEGEPSDGVSVNSTDPQGLDAVFNASNSDGQAGGYWGGGAITATALDVPINKPQLYGGDDREGGIVGTMDVYMGDADQTLGTRIIDIMQGVRLSALRGVLTCFYDGEVCANNPYPKAWKFRLRRALKGWDGEVWYPNRAVIMLSDPAIAASQAFDATVGEFKVTQTAADGTVTEVITAADGTQTINSYSPVGGGLANATMVPAFRNEIYAMNPAHIIYEVCTNRDWGRGLDRALMDELTFTNAANHLYNENFGLCIKWSRSEDIDSFLQTVIDHIGAVLYTDKINNRLCLRLIRDDYIRGDLPVFDYAHGLLALETVEDSAQDATANEVIVKYNSPVLNADKEARAQNIASVSALGSIFSVTRQYPGVPTSTLATLVAQRDLRAMSAGLKRVTFTVDRRGYLINPGDVVIINAPSEGLPNAVIRVAQIEDSTLADGTIKIMGAQDRFGLPLTPFIVHEPVSFQEPNLYPYPIIDQHGNEATFRDLNKLQGAAFAQGVPEMAGYAVLTARAPTPSATAFDLQTQWHHAFSSEIDPWKDVITCRFCKASYTGPLSISATTFPVTGDFNPRNVDIGMCLKLTTLGTSTVGNEEYAVLRAINVDSFGNTIITVGRGCVDTPARAFPDGAVIWAYDQTGAGDPTEYSYIDIIGMRGITKTSRGKLPEDRSSVVLVGMFGRPFRSYPAADVRVNGQQDGYASALGPDLVVTWKHRNRITQADKLIDETEASITPETGTEYELTFIGTGGTWAAPIQTGTTYTFTAAAIAAVGGSAGPFTLMMRTQRNDGSSPSYNSAVYYYRFSYGIGSGGGGASGFGNNFGNAWGV